MADFVKMAAPNHYIGASTDTKPTSVAVGSRCYEHDTKKWFITQDGGTTWTETQDLDALVLGAGTALIGSVSIDQTTPGTTNLVAVTSMGEVQASPTANTLLGRLDEIEAAIDDMIVLIGEVQASPTENSLLERQKAIETALTAINTLIGAVTASPTENTLLERLKAIETTLLTLVVLGAGNNLIGKVGIDQTTPGTTNGVSRTKGGLLNSGVLSADTQIKTGAAEVHWITVSDSAALTIDLEDASGSGTSKWGIDLPASGYGHFIFDPPIEFTTGIFLDVNTATCKVTVGYK